VEHSGSVVVVRPVVVLVEVVDWFTGVVVVVVVAGAQTCKPS